MAHKRFVGRSSPSLKTWLGQGIPVFGSDIAAGDGLFSPGLKSFGGPGDEDVTILRTRGDLIAVSESITPASQVIQLALGIGLCTTEAAAAGAVPLPFDNPQWDGWFVYMVMGLQPGGGGTGSVLQTRSVIDSKAMRKIPSGQVLFLSTQLFTASGGGAITISQSIQARVLLKTS